MKKILTAVFILAITLASLSSQENKNISGKTTEGVVTAEQNSTEKKRLFGSTYTAPRSAKEFWSQVSPLFNLGTAITVNTESKLKSAPSPVNFALSVGASWPNNAFVSFQPRLTFWMQYYLWDGENALPAEIENRTAHVLNFMIDIPVAATFRFNSFQIETGTGLGILARAAFLANGVKENDTGASGSAGEDKNRIQDWMWQNGRFLYPEIFAAVEYRITERISAGLEARWYIPLGSLLEGRGLDASILMFGGKVIF